MQSGLTRFGFQVQRLARHTFVQQLITLGRVVLHRIACRRVDFGAAGTHLDQAHQGGRAGQIQGQAEDAHTAQRLERRHAGELWSDERVSIMDNANPSSLDRPS